ncbi:B9 domain-containing protein 2 [Culicoides brevitarsis]|uniref:B9 domain-containing protein 2 n=1 Tax=Culicoides brevitarsis TaxID=469753 RepID=UPI00307C4452
MAEIHLIGQVLDAIDFDEPNLFCKWSIQISKFCKVIEGHSEAVTCTNRNRFEEKLAVFASPIDLHLSCRSVHGWPKIHIEIYSVDGLEKCHPIGFGFAHIPIKPGYQFLEIPTWKVATTNILDSIQDKFHTSGLTVEKSDLIYSGIERYKLRTASAGTVRVELMVILKNLGKFGTEIK